MELWIRSQDRTDLVKVNVLWIMDNQIWMEVPFYENHKKIGLSVTGNNHKLAEYKSKERALEVLDEIQDKIKTFLYLKPKTLLRLDEIKSAKRYFEKMNGVDFITCDSRFEIEPITTNAIVYEMPKE